MYWCIEEQIVPWGYTEHTDFEINEYVCIPIKHNIVKYVTMSGRKGKGIEKMTLQSRSHIHPIQSSEGTGPSSEAA